MNPLPPEVGKKRESTGSCFTEGDDPASRFGDRSQKRAPNCMVLLRSTMKIECYDNYDDYAIEQKLDQLEADGHILVEGALSSEETEHIRGRINHAREMGWADGLNQVGNMWFDTLLDREPETFAPLVGHPGVRPYLEGMMGKQCQLRSLRIHINPGAYLQEWHLDFYGYWEEKREAAKSRLTVPPISINTTFYFQDNGPGLGHLKYVKNGHRDGTPAPLSDGSPQV